VYPLIERRGLLQRSEVDSGERYKRNKMHEFRYADKEAGQKAHFSESSGGGRASLYLTKACLCNFSFFIPEVS
jgi:hypothetical protein